MTVTLKFIFFLIFEVFGIICEPSQTCRTAEEKKICYEVCEILGQIRPTIDLCQAGCERCDCKRGGQNDDSDDIDPNFISCIAPLPHFDIEPIPIVIPPNEKLRD